MGNDLTEIGQGTLVRSSADIMAQRTIILDVMKKCMKKGEDYGIIPGCKLPSLYKPGAEKILSVFRIAVDEPKVEDLSTEDERRYRVTIRLISCTGVFLGSTVGECSSDEDKYKWKKAVCEDEWKETPENMRRDKWKPGKEGKAYKVKQIRTNIADVANTILSMACKRAMVADTRQVTAASDLFTQEIESLEDLINNGGDPDDNIGKPTTEAPKTAEEAAKEPDTTKAVIPEVTGKVLKISPRPFKAKDKDKKDIMKPHTFYIVKNEELGEIEIQTWAEPVKEIKEGGNILAKDVEVGEYNKKATYTAKSISVDIPL